jgi:hypothetical protein
MWRRVVWRLSTLLVAYFAQPSMLKAKAECGYFLHITNKHIPADTVPRPGRYSVVLVVTKSKLIMSLIRKKIYFYDGEFQNKTSIVLWQLPMCNSNIQIGLNFSIFIWKCFIMCYFLLDSLARISLQVTYSSSSCAVSVSNVTQYT